MNEPWRHHAEWKKTGTTVHIVWSHWCEPFGVGGSIEKDDSWWPREGWKRGGCWVGTRDDHVWELDRGDRVHVANVLTPLNCARPLLLCVIELSLCRVQLFLTSWIAVLQASLSFTMSWSFLKLMSIELMDTIHPSHPLLSPFLPALNLSQHQGLFYWVGFSH